MNQTISFVVNFLLCALDIYMLDIFFSAMFLKRVSRKRWFVCFIAAVCIQSAINLPGITMLNFVAVPILFFYFVMLVFEISVNKAFVYTAIYHIVFACGKDMAFEMLYHLLFEMFPRLERMLSAGGMLFYMVEYLLSILFLLYLRKYMREIEMSKDGRFDWYLLVMPLSSVLIILNFAYMDFPDERYLQVLMCSGAFSLYFSNAVIFIILAHFAQAMNQIKMVELSLLKRDMEKENFDSMAKINEVYKKYMHDVHQYFYQFKSLAAAGENEAIIDIINGWENNLKQEESNKLYTGSPVINSLLSRCYDNAKERRVKIDIFVEPALNLDFIQDVDKISMFGNLLDNALEAVSECEERKRKIKIRMFMGNKHFLIFRIENTWVKSKLRMDGGKLLSTKKDSRNHGLGIGISRELAQKYGGSLELEEQGEWFVATLMTAR